MKNNKQKYIIGALALLPLLTTGCKYGAQNEAYKTIY